MTGGGPIEVFPWEFTTRHQAGKTSLFWSLGWDMKSLVLSMADPFSSHPYS